MKKKPAKDLQILEAAQDEFLRSGIINASMKRIAIEANVSKRTLYKYYPSKVVLFDELVELCRRIVDSKMVFPYESNDSLHVALGNIIDERLNLLTDRQFVKLVKVMFVGQLKQDVTLPRLLSIVANSAKEKFVKWLSLAEKDRKITSKEPIVYISDNMFLLLDGTVLLPQLLSAKDGFSASEITEIKYLVLQDMMRKLVPGESGI